MDQNLIGMCGAYCDNCDWKEKMNCPGCQANQSKVFWGECNVAKCSIENGIKHCGHCNKVPCETLQGFFDNEEHGDNGERLTNLKNWANGDNIITELTSKKNK